MTLRIKISLALVFTSLFASATVGGIAEWLLKRDFRNAVMKEAFRNFEQDVAAYVDRYGSIENVAGAEEFNAFVVKRRSPPVPKGSPLSERGERIVPPRETGMIDRKENPPFQFLLMDTHGKVVFATSGFVRGQIVTRKLFHESLPVSLRGNVVAYAYPQGEPRLTDRDRAYFSAIRRALFLGVIVASVLSTGIGLLFGHSLSLALSRLTRSISALGTIIERRDADVELQMSRVQEKSSVRPTDEIGVLALNFNLMVERLAMAYRELKDESIRDPLTGLHNRRYFDEQAALLYQIALRHDHSFCVVIADIDYFKKINDGYSHVIGDEVLRHVAQIMAANIRKSDVLARYGGEEFILLLPESKLEDSIALSERIRSAIEKHPWYGVQEGLQVTISMGISDSLDLGSIGRMIVEADKYLYLAKKRGRNRIEFPGNQRREKVPLWIRIRNRT